jgi:alpha-tubulin suppressor-like RCC1 family protein
LAIKTNGTLWAWGIDSYGQLGQGPPANKSSPVQIAGSWKQVASGYEFSIGIKADGTLWGWGYNLEGEVGDNTVISRNTPTPIGAATNWSSISSSYGHTVAIKMDGTLWAWGYNSDGQLGTGNITSLSSPVQVAGASTWSKISAGAYHTLALQADGTLWVWGANSEGQLGHGGATNPTGSKSTPFQVPGTWSQVAAGPYHSLGVKTDGTLWSWGYNFNGQLGLGTSGTGTGSTTPVRIGALSTWAKVATGSFISSAIRTDGTLWTWGNNSVGTIGDSTLTQRNAPVAIPGSWIQLTGGDFHTVAIKKK